MLCILQPLSGVKVSRRGRPSLTPIADQRLEILKLSSGGTRSIVKQEETCVICEEGDGTLLHCNGPCLRVFHAKCIGLIMAPASSIFTCDECLTGMVVVYLFYFLFRQQKLIIRTLIEEDMCVKNFRSLH